MRVWNDMRYWPREWRHSHDDVHIEQVSENMWGRTVPEVWPENEEDAEAFYVEQVTHNFGCPFAWLLQ